MGEHSLNRLYYMEIPEQLRCLFSAPITDKGDSYVVEIPTQAVQHGELGTGEIYRVALLPADASTQTKEPHLNAESDPGTDPDRVNHHPEPPVKEGDRRKVEIESLGDQGDGIARVERGFVVIVPETERGEQATVEITDVQDTVAFAEVVEHENHPR
jgi:predicted RNA-binding protein with TRAM domain